MARCNLGNHAECTACKEFVNAEGNHLHHYSPRGGPRYGILCVKCSLHVLLAAETLLRALERYRNSSGDQSSLEKLQDEGRIVIGIQETLTSFNRDFMN